ncbi:uncharacterized protein LOC110942638 [Helianthus annuus]|uniref:uncharacterized protein LOC110942638 n=1 Tax=Helianthus annuus TaxID=4232 RepID=UPI000B909856|nr:uncharacterized protein LOC110942638 [Helianthus annuus]
MDVVDACGRSGGLVNIWDKKIFKKVDGIKNGNFLVTSGYIKGVENVINIMNVYAPQKTIEKRTLWEAIAAVKRNSNGWWIVLGDFNSVRSREERRNTKFDAGSAEDFNVFIEDSELQEYTMQGKRFTFLAGKGNGLKMIKIDRVLVCSEPFRWFNSWLEIDGCIDVVKDAVSGVEFVGPPDMILSKKLMLIRDKLKEWKNVWSKKQGEEVDTMRAEKEKLEDIMECRDLEEEEMWVWSECSRRVEEWEAHRLQDLKQKSRVKWPMFGDDNSAFFHGIVNGRKAANSIPGLEINGKWISKPSLVKKEVYKHFRDHFRDNNKDRPLLVVDNLKLSRLQAKIF